jgi:hypothetical protein
MKTQGKAHFTQWAGQYGVAHELSRRGYLVTLTLGNTPRTDLLCQSPSGILFGVEVKSLRSKGWFLYQEALLEPSLNRFFVFVHVPESISEPSEYFVLASQQFRDLKIAQDRMNRETEKKRGKPYASFAPGLKYSMLAKGSFRNAWGSLPQ